MIPNCKIKIPGILLALVVSILFLSCQKDFSENNGNVQPNLPDLSTKVNSSISGFVTDENNDPVSGATVKSGTNTIMTDEYGYFEFNNIQVVKNAAVITATKSGYFNGIKTFIAEDGKSAFFRIKLIPKTASGSFSASAGGIVTLPNGLTLTFPSNTIVNASTMTAYTGNVSVAAHWINPAGTDIEKEMPGDLRGLDEDGALKLLTTYGMAAVELTGNSGEVLQIAPGSKATLTLPLPAALIASAPATIPLWYFDEGTGLWKEEGSAVKTGNAYVGEVSHFSFWNCDVPNNYIRFNCTIIDASGNPVSHAMVKISVVGNSNNAGYGYTDSSGYVSGAIPNNAQLLLEVYSNYNCGTPVYSQNFNTTNVNLSLGTITINTTSYVATLSGTVTDCSNNPVTNGYVILQMNYQNYRVALDNTGSYSFSTLLCNNTADVILVAEDITGLQQNTPLNYTIIAGANNIPAIMACGVTTQQYVNFTVNGTPYAFTYPTDSITQFGNTITTPPNTGGLGISGASGNNNIYFFSSGVVPGPNSSVVLSYFTTTYINDSLNIPTSIMIQILEFDAPGGFVSGNFSGTFIGASPSYTPYNVTCSFRARRRS